MNKRNDYLDQRNDFNGPDKGKRNYPKRPQHVKIEKGTEKE
ncbi:hypothetical protein [Mesobacillus maritimus]